MHSMAADESAGYARCDSQWKALAANASKDRVGLEADWKGKSKECAGTGIYEFRLATLVEVNGRRDEAIAILDGALAKDLPLRDDMRAIRLGMLFSKAQYSIPKNSKEARKAHEELETLLVNNPNLVAAMHQLAMQRLDLEDFVGAETMSRRAMEHDPGAWQPRRTLFLALIANDKFSEARQLLRPTLELHERLFSDPEFMLAASYCYLKLGDVKTAEQALRALRSKVPAVQDDPAYARLARRILDAKESTADSP
jgi:tetratricopeptide (TPR) repeat protein